MENNAAAVGNHYHHQLRAAETAEQKQELEMFMQQQKEEIGSLTDFKTHQLPLARIKKIMKSDEDVHMIAGEAPIVFAKACEMFVLDLTFRSWLHAQEDKRRTLQKSDISAVIDRTEMYDFLLDGDAIPTDPRFFVEPQFPGQFYHPPSASGMYAPPLPSEAFGTGERFSRAATSEDP